MVDINRSLIIVRPTQRFLDWVQSVDHDEQLTLEQARHDPSAYLVPEIVFDDEQPALLEWCYEEIFEAELFSWYTDPSLWPQNRDLKMFLEWFEVQFHSGVFDLCDGPIQVETYDTLDDEPASGGNGKPLR